MKLAFLGDLHYGVRNDSEIFYNLQKQFFTEVFFPKLKENGVTTVIQVGDFFDRRQYINFKTLYYLKDYLPQLLQEYDIQMYVEGFRLSICKCISINFQFRYLLRITGILTMDSTVQKIKMEPLFYGDGGFQGTVG